MLPQPLPVPGLLLHPKAGAPPSPLREIRKPSPEPAASPLMAAILGALGITSDGRHPLRRLCLRRRAPEAVGESLSSLLCSSPSHFMYVCVYGVLFMWVGMYIMCCVCVCACVCRCVSVYV